MIIVLDTTEMFSNPYADGLNFTLLRDFVNSENASVVVPKIVLEETINHFRELLREAERDARSSLARLNSRTLHKERWQFPPINVEEETKNYELSLVKRLKDLRIEVVDYDHITLSVLVERALARRKPFDSKGNAGFRDAIIWETVMKLVKGNGRHVVLVTNNFSDFGSDKGLVSDLATDLIQAGLTTERVSIVRSLDDFNKKYVLPRLNKLKEIRLAIEEGEYDKFDAEAYFKEKHVLFVDIAAEIAEMIEIGRIDRILRNFRLAGLSLMPSSFQVDDVYRIDDTQIAVFIWYFFDGIVTCDRFKPLDSNTMTDDGLFSEAVHFDASVNVVIDLETGEAENFECSSNGWELGPEWPSQSD